MLYIHNAHAHTYTHTHTHVRTQVTMSKGTKVVADSFINDVKDKDYSAIILPGGHEGSISLSNSDTLRTMLNAHAKSNKVYGGLCAAPAKVLHKWGLLHGKRATSYPDKEYQDEMSEHQQPENFQERTIRDGNVLTSQGA